MSLHTNTKNHVSTPSVCGVCVGGEGDAQRKSVERFMLAPALPLHEQREAEKGEGRSPYREAQLQAAEAMQSIRAAVADVDALTPQHSPSTRVELINRIRRGDAELRRLMVEARRLAHDERRSEELLLLEAQNEKTERLVQTRLAAGGLSSSSAAAPDGVHAFAGADPFASREAGGGEGRDHGEPYNLHQDVEFAEFFALTQQRDTEIDQALDRIHHGVKRLNDNAKSVHEELHVQEKLLDRTEKDVETNKAKMQGMNVRMRKAIKKLGKSRLITYAVLCVILVVLIIVIVLLGKSL